jgi:hypothetical protein
MLFLAALFLTNGGKNLVVESLNGHVVVKHAGPLINGGRIQW